MIVLQIVAFLAGLYLVAATVMSAIKTFVLPRAAPVLISRMVFVAIRRAIDALSPPSRPFAERDRHMALFAPISLLSLPVVWLTLLLLGFTGMFWGAGVSPLARAYTSSGSSLLTLGFERPDALFPATLAFIEAALGLLFVALLISYLPTIYAAFSRRETEVSALEALADTPPSPLTLLVRHHLIDGLDRLGPLFDRWREWFADIEESHVSIAAIVFFRSPEAGRSWVTAAGCILDSAALVLACIDGPPAPDAALCLRSGFVTLRRIAAFYALPNPEDPAPDDPISIERAEFDAVVDALADYGMPLTGDREQAWRDFAGWRVNYDVVLRRLAGLVMAPTAMWSGDRAIPYRRPPFLLPSRPLLRRR